MDLYSETFPIRQFPLLARLVYGERNAPKGSGEYLKAAGSHVVVYNGIEHMHWYDCMTDIVLG